MKTIEERIKCIKAVCFKARDLVLVLAEDPDFVGNMPAAIQEKIDHLVVAVLELDEAYSGEA